MTLYQLHVQKWKNGCGNAICESAHKVCLARGCVPCDVLFIGEAPGVSENVLGTCFVGPAGKLLDAIVARSVGVINAGRAAAGMPPLRCAYTNLLGCMPLDADGDKAGTPDPTELRQCRTRLAEFHDLCRPRLIVCVGSLARTNLDKAIPHRDARSVAIDHPAAMLRAPAVQRQMMEQRAVVAITTAAEDL